ncbi:hypothetical protein [Galactobacter sp.]|uniref:hypothetical protein n=1 Tax=Galactobacter sp. TaxID=2676125 RepID=UPI0025C03D9D|nr:hypothetical protein [Galactobacter sp.]
MREDSRAINVGDILPDEVDQDAVKTLRWKAWMEEQLTESGVALTDLFPGDSRGPVARLASALQRKVMPLKEHYRLSGEIIEQLDAAEKCAVECPSFQREGLYKAVIPRTEPRDRLNAIVVALDGLDSRLAQGDLQGACGTTDLEKVRDLLQPIRDLAVHPIGCGAVRRLEPQPVVTLP